MGFGGVSLWQLAIVLGIVILLFGTKKLRNIGGDLGSAVKGFKKAMNDGVLSDNKKEEPAIESKEESAIEAKKDAEFVERSSVQSKTEEVTADTSDKKS